MHNRIMLMLALLVPATAASGQEAPATLSLEEAVALAREHNPDFRAQVNDRTGADWGVRSAYATFLPTATVGGGLSYQQGGSARIGGFTADDIGLSNTPDYYYSSYSIGLRLGLTGADLYRVGREKAARRSVLASLEGSELALEGAVTRQYVAALRARDAVALARSELDRAEGNLSLAEARYEVEAATGIEAKQAEVERGRAQVSLLRAEAALRNQKVRLLELLGVEVNADVELTSEVTVFEPQWEVEALVAAALASQPELESARAGLEATETDVDMARTAYWPSLSLSTGFSGFTRRAGNDQFLLDRALGSARQQCSLTNQLATTLQLDVPLEDCSQIQLSDRQRASILAENNKFPFDFDTEPLSVSLGVSVPVFQGLSRQQQLETARTQAEDARWQLRARELSARADVETAFRDLNTAYEAVQLEARNRELARDQLRLARERYRVGSAAFLELLEAEALMARADREYLLGVYTFQEALTALEQAVGQKLAIPQN